MRLVASAKALDFVREHGGRLYVSPRSRRCCHGAITWLEASIEPDERVDFRRAAVDELELYLPTTLGRLPDELHLELRGRRRKRVEAYWDGCAFVA
jgi:hypothetical protein